MNYSNRGKYAETKVDAYLKWWQGDDTVREASRLVDSKAAGRIIKAAKADFEYFCVSNGVNVHGLIEVKQTEHAYRLARPHLTQLPNLRKRDKCGGDCYVVVYHSEIRAWRCLSVGWLMSNGDKGSWNLSAVPTFDTCFRALGHKDPEVFTPWTK